MRYVTNAERIGIQKGLEIGREQKALEIAQAMLGKGMAVEDIADVTKLSIAQIQQIQITLENKISY